MENNINGLNSSDKNNEEIGEDNNDKDINELLINKKKKFSFVYKYKIYLLIFFSIIIISLIISLCIYFSEKKSCEIGKEEKCLTCNEDKCGSCNLGYKLDNGKCKLNYSFKAIYYTSTNNTNISLIYNDYLGRIIEMNLDGKNIKPTTNYIFPFSGNHTLYLLLNITNHHSLNSLFLGIENLKSIYFSKLFNTINITNMSNMFLLCTSLIDIDLSNLNTINVEDMSFMFYNCKSLSSINVLDFNT